MNKILNLNLKIMQNLQQRVESLELIYQDPELTTTYFNAPAHILQERLGLLNEITREHAAGNISMTGRQFEVLEQTVEMLVKTLEAKRQKQEAIMQNLRFIEVARPTIGEQQFMMGLWVHINQTNNE